MNKRSIRGEASSTAHKRRATAPQDEESPLPPATSSLAHQASSSSIPKIPLDLIADLILPFVADRATWNSVYCASKDLCLAGKKMAPPWPNKVFNNLKDEVRHMKCATLLFLPPDHSWRLLEMLEILETKTTWFMFGIDGKDTLLVGHIGNKIFWLEYSLDGEYLASGCQDGSIRLWHADSFHAASSMTSRELQEQADIIILGSRYNFIMALSFSRADSNILASGGLNREIKVWNVKEQA
jgi:hypothetical protein